MLEIWRPVGGFVGLYEVSDQGRIRSIDRKVKSRFGLRAIQGKLLSPIVNSRGYLVVNLTNGSSRAQYFLHRIVLEAFVGIRPYGFDGCHNNGDKCDARIENLRWDTRSSNHQDKKLHGTAQVGEKANNVKLTNEIVSAIRNGNLRPCEAVRAYGLSKTNAKRIVSGETWRHLL